MWNHWDLYASHAMITTTFIAKVATLPEPSTNMAGMAYANIVVDVEQSLGHA